MSQFDIRKHIFIGYVSSSDLKGLFKNILLRRGTRRKKRFNIALKMI